MVEAVRTATELAQNDEKEFRQHLQQHYSRLSRGNRDSALEGAGTTIMVLPTVALRGNILERVAKMGIRTILWSPGQTRSAPLVIVSAEATCTEGFDEYVIRLESRQRLDRIVIDECHLTITANDYYKSIKYLGWYIRRVCI
ncbi:hypothetical protein BKA56DRAFT_612069 [Ilyonectria sp. MPI-CAGE-AT-0026]|nr:hypothetical protein BKA56DRAFT_612069 [Ilyonectria sp. MPI-CAGE-AT-0026]